MEAETTEEVKPMRRPKLMRKLKRPKNRKRKSRKRKRRRLKKRLPLLRSKTVKRIPKSRMRRKRKAKVLFGQNLNLKADAFHH